MGASSPVHDRILRFTSGPMPVDLLVASMEAELISSMYLQTSIRRARDWDQLCTYFKGVLCPEPNCNIDIDVAMSVRVNDP